MASSCCLEIILFFLGGTHFSPFFGDLFLFLPGAQKKTHTGRRHCFRTKKIHRHQKSERRLARAKGGNQSVGHLALHSPLCPRRTTSDGLGSSTQRFRNAERRGLCVCFFLPDQLTQVLNGIFLGLTFLGKHIYIF